MGSIISLTLGIIALILALIPMIFWIITELFSDKIEKYLVKKEIRKKRLERAKRYIKNKKLK